MKMLDFTTEKIFKSKIHTRHYSVVSQTTLDAIRLALSHIIRGQLVMAYSHLLDELQEVAGEDA